MQKAEGERGGVFILPSAFRTLHCKEDAGRFQTAMHDVLLMGVVDGPRQDFDQRQRLGERQGFALERLGQGWPLHMFDGIVEQLAFALAGFEDLTRCWDA